MTERPGEKAEASLRVRDFGRRTAARPTRSPPSRRLRSAGNSSRPARDVSGRATARQASTSRPVGSSDDTASSSTRTTRVRTSKETQDRLKARMMSGSDRLRLPPGLLNRGPAGSEIGRAAVVLLHGLRAPIPPFRVGHDAVDRRAERRVDRQREPGSSPRRVRITVRFWK